MEMLQSEFDAQGIGPGSDLQIGPVPSSLVPSRDWQQESPRSPGLSDSSPSSPTASIRSLGRPDSGGSGVSAVSGASNQSQKPEAQPQSQPLQQERRRETEMSSAYAWPEVGKKVEVLVPWPFRAGEFDSNDVNADSPESDDTNSNSDTASDVSAGNDTESDAHEDPHAELAPQQCCK